MLIVGCTRITYNFISQILNSHHSPLPLHRNINLSWNKFKDQNTLLQNLHKPSLSVYNRNVIVERWDSKRILACILKRVTRITCYRHFWGDYRHFLGGFYAKLQSLNAKPSLHCVYRPHCQFYKQICNLLHYIIVI